MIKVKNDIAALSKQCLPSSAPVSEDFITVSEVENLARERLPRAVYDYYACGLDDQYALTRNIDAFSQ